MTPLPIADPSSNWIASEYSAGYEDLTSQVDRHERRRKMFIEPTLTHIGHATEAVLGISNFGYDLDLLFVSIPAEFGEDPPIDGEEE